MDATVWTAVIGAIGTLGAAALAILRHRKRAVDTSPELAHRDGIRARALIDVANSEVHGLRETYQALVRDVAELSGRIGSMEQWRDDVRGTIGESVSLGHRNSLELAAIKARLDTAITAMGNQLAQISATVAAIYGIATEGKS